MTECLEARGWKGIGKLFGLSDKKCIQGRLRRLGLVVSYDGQTPVIPVSVVKEAVLRSFRGR